MINLYVKFIVHSSKGYSYKVIGLKVMDRRTHRMTTIGITQILMQPTN